MVTRIQYVWQQFSGLGKKSPPYIFWQDTVCKPLLVYCQTWYGLSCQNMDGEGLLAFVKMPRPQILFDFVLLSGCTGDCGPSITISDSFKWIWIEWFQYRLQEKVPFWNPHWMSGKHLPCYTIFLIIITLWIICCHI